MRMDFIKHKLKCDVRHEMCNTTDVKVSKLISKSDKSVKSDNIFMYNVRIFIISKQP